MASAITSFDELTGLEAHDSRLYRIAPELRRSAAITMVGMLPCIAAVLYVDQVVQPRNVLFSCGFLAAIAACMILPLRWAIRVDGQGIWRRRVVGWDLFPWRDFAAGHIHKRHPVTFVDQRRPWWRRGVRLDAMRAEDMKEVLALVNRIYRLPPAPTVPEELQIHYGYRRHATFDVRGVHVSVRGTQRTYVWQDVTRVRIVRVDPLRRDFRRLELFLPDHEIQLQYVSHHGIWSPGWRGGDAEAINELLLERVPAERVDVEILGECPSRLVDVERLIAKIDSSDRQYRLMFRIFVPLMAALLLWMAIADGVWKALIMSILVVTIVLVLNWVGRELRERRQRLESWRKSLNGRQN